MVGTDGRGGLREGRRVVGTGGGGGRGAWPRRCSSSCRSRRVGLSSCPPFVSSSFGRRASLSFGCCTSLSRVGVRSCWFWGVRVVWAVGFVVWVVCGIGRISRLPRRPVATWLWSSCRLVWLVVSSSRGGGEAVGGCGCRRVGAVDVPPSFHIIVIEKEGG